MIIILRLIQNPQGWMTTLNPIVFGIWPTNTGSLEINLFDWLKCKARGVGKVKLGAMW